MPNTLLAAPLTVPPRPATCRPKLPFEAELSHAAPVRKDILISGIPALPLEALADLCRSESVSVRDGLLAAFRVLLWRYLDSSEIAVLCTDVDHASGVHQQVVRLPIAAGSLFRHVLREAAHARAAASPALDTIPLEPALAEPMTTPEFRFAWFEPGNAAASPASLLAAHEPRALPLDFTLSLNVIRRPDSLQLALEYDTRRFARADVQLFLEAFEILVDSILVDPSGPVENACLLSEDQRNRILAQFNQTDTAYPREKFVHELVGLQAHGGEPWLAIDAPGQQLTSEQLHSHSDMWAGHWLASGLESGQIAIVLAPPGTEAVIAMLAVLKAGGVCAPVDPRNAEPYLSYLTRREATTVVVTSSAYTHLLGGWTGRVLLLDQLPSPEALHPLKRAPRRHPGDPAFVVPGAGGAPVLLSHRNIVHAICARAVLYTRPVSRYLWTAPVGAAASISGLFWTLLQGGTVVIPGPEDLRNADAFAAAVARDRISHVLLAPDEYERWMAEASPTDLASLECTVVAADRCQDSLLQQHCERQPHLPLHLEYGYAEATGWSTSLTCEPARHARGCIGRPIPNAQLYVLDPLGRPVPVWVPGEIHIGGDGVALQHLDRPDLDAVKFVLNTFSRTPGARLYRTGDRGRFLPDGTVEFLNSGPARAGLAVDRPGLADDFDAKNVLGPVAELISRAVETPTALSPVESVVYADVRS